MATLGEMSVTYCFLLFWGFQCPSRRPAILVQWDHALSLFTSMYQISSDTAPGLFASTHKENLELPPVPILETSSES